MRRFVLPGVLCVSIPSALSVWAAEEPRAPDALERFRALVGSWRGTVAWSGARSDTGAMDATNALTGGGSAVVENLISGGQAVMTSVYHQDGPDLRMTHFCAARNQPRFRATSADIAPTGVRFSYVVATNLKSPEAPHVTAFEIRFKDADHLTLLFTFEGAGKTSLETIELARVARPRRHVTEPSPHPRARRAAATNSPAPARRAAAARPPKRRKSPSSRDGRIRQGPRRARTRFGAALATARARSADGWRSRRWNPAGFEGHAHPSSPSGARRSTSSARRAPYTPRIRLRCHAKCPSSMKRLVVICGSAGVNPSRCVRMFASGSTSGSGTTACARRSEMKVLLLSVPR